MSLPNECNLILYFINSAQFSLTNCSQSKLLPFVGFSTGENLTVRPIEHLFKQVHWLKTPERIAYKICHITHKCVWNNALEFLCYTLSITNDRTFQLEVKRCDTVHSEQAFSRSAGKLWNCLPLSLRAESDTKV